MIEPQSRFAELEEWLDVYDDNFQWVGRKTREAVHRDGDWHQTFDCWMVRRHPSPAVLFQRRSSNKLDYPGLWDTSVGGHVRAGESLCDASREIAEELGIVLPFADLVPLGLRLAAASTPTRIDREFQQIFLAEVNLRLEAFRPDAQEVSGLTWMELNQVMDLFQGRRESLRLSVLETSGQSRTLTLRSSAFVPCRDRYYQRVCLAASRYLAGEQDLAI